MVRIKKEKIFIEFDIEYEEIQWKGNWIPKTVYKYRDWGTDSHKFILEKFELWISDSLNFNDPFDCNIPVAYDLITKDEGIAEQFIRNIVTAHVNKYGGDLELEVKEKLALGKHKDPAFIDSVKKSIHEKNRKNHGIFSATPINNNILMWSHYANCHKGFCVGFDSKKLFEHLAGGGGEILYEKTYPIISPIDERQKQYAMQIMTKSIHWTYEVEYRLTTLMKVNQAVEFPADIITEIIFGSRISETHKNEIKDLVAKKLPHVKLFSAKPHDSDFKLNIVPE